MKPVLTMALGLSVSFLTACGGSSSSSSDSVQEYDLSTYEGRTVSTENLVGTWVMVATGTELSSLPGITSNSSSATKEYFVVRETESGDFESSDCGSGFSTLIIEGNIMTLEGGTATIIDNQKVSGSLENNYVGEGVFEGYNTTRTATFQSVKISDSVESFGSISKTVAGEDTVTEGIFCFAQNNSVGTVSSEDGSGSYKGTDFEVGLENSSDDDFSFDKWSGTSSGFEIEIDLDTFSTDEGNEASFTVDSESSTSIMITYNGSNDSGDVSGTVQIQLPLQ